MSNKNFVAYGDAETVLTEFASDIKEKENIFRYSTMPTASSTNVGQIIQYTGETTSVAPIYTNGYFYKCVAQGTDPETYAWEAQPVQEGGGADNRIGEEITEIGVRKSGAVFTPYIKFLYELPSFDDLTWDEVIGFAQMYYNGDISLNTIKDSWSIGDSIQLNLGAIGAYSDTTYIDETHAAQTVEMVIIDFDHDPLKTSIGGKTKALITLHMKDCLNEKGCWDKTGPSWQPWSETKRRDWCNTNVYEAIPSNVQSGIKMVSRNNFKTESGNDPGQIEIVDDKIFIPTLYEIITVSGSGGYADGTRYPYYNTTVNRIKKVNGSNRVWWTSKNNDGEFDEAQYLINTAGNVSTCDKNLVYYSSTHDIGIAFAFCI